MQTNSGNKRAAANTILAAATVTILMAAGAISPAFAVPVGTTYGNSALTGCYSDRVTSVDTQPGAYNTAEVGTLCFDGAGTIVYQTIPVDATGNCADVNGVSSCSLGARTGTYTVTNSPGDGMGLMYIYALSGALCEVHAFSINSVIGGLAHGFDFSRMAKYSGTGCSNPASSARVKTGVATYQGP